MKSKFSSRLAALVALGIVAATFLAACSSTSETSSSQETSHRMRASSSVFR